ncbi:MAG: glycosyltransferase [Chitinivibrionales bacterium]|nr:glycosyltransferase [Chitinivibrionales bacterium]
MSAWYGICVVNRSIDCCCARASGTDGAGRMDVSIVIINWNSADYLRQCLRSIAARTGGVRIETIVADNGSRESPRRAIRREFPWVTFLEFGCNHGFAKANNLAARGARGRYLLFLNPDTRMVTDAITGMARFLDCHPTFDIVGSQLLNADGSIQRTCARTYPSPLRQFSQLATLDRLFPRVRFLNSVELESWDHRDSREIDCISGACLMVRKETMVRRNGFDEGLFMYAEDVDLCYRVVRSGGRIYYLASEQVIHYGGGSSQPHSSARILSMLRQREATLYFMHKHYGRRAAMAYRAAVMAGSAVRIGTMALATPLSYALPGKALVPKGAWRKYGTMFAWSLGLRHPDNRPSLNRHQTRSELARDAC